jgi:hypothetical protein
MVAVGPFAEASKCDQNTVTFIGCPLDGLDEFYLRSRQAALVWMLHLSSEAILFLSAICKLSYLAFDGHVTGNYRFKRRPLRRVRLSTLTLFDSLIWQLVHRAPGFHL